MKACKKNIVTDRGQLLKGRGGRRKNKAKLNKRRKSLKRPVQPQHPGEKTKIFTLTNVHIKEN